MGLDKEGEKGEICVERFRIQPYTHTQHMNKCLHDCMFVTVCVCVQYRDENRLSS